MQLADKSWTWAAVVLICIALNGGAFYSQHVLSQYPCELCIYVRVWVFGIGIIAALGLMLHRWPAFRIVLLLILLLLTAGLARHTWGLLAIDYQWPMDGACSFVPAFPSWAPLDQWWPAMFKVENLCQPTPYVLWKLTMADGLAGTCFGFFATFLWALVAEVRAKLM